MLKYINLKLIGKELDEQLEKTVKTLVVRYLGKYRKMLVEDYISRNFSKFMSEDRLLTSEEVMNMLQISRQTLGRRVKAGVLNPVNPEAKRNYRFKKNDVINLIERKGMKYD